MADLQTKELLPEGTHFGSPWGIYQTPLTVQLALNLGWDPHDRISLEKICHKTQQHMGMSYLTQEEDMHLNESLDEALEYINDHHVAEGYWFGHHADIGDMGVWPIED